jgi:hypothetical protein
MILDPPIHLIAGGTGCWRCGASMTVVALLDEGKADSDHGPVILTNIRELPPEILGYVCRRFPTFKLKYSKTIGGKYYANTCPKCGVLSGDFFLHSEPGAPFFPTEPAEAKELTIEELPINHQVSVQAGCGYGTGDLILQFAKRISRTNA